MREKEFRFALLEELLEKGYPKSLIATELSIEKIAALGNLPIPLPKRRVDVVCWQRGKTKPLLLIECKAFQSWAGFDQLFSYNHYLGAFYTALAWPGNVVLQQGDESWQLGELPGYEELVEGISCSSCRCGGMVDAVDSKSTPH